MAAGAVDITQLYQVGSGVVTRPVSLSNGDIFIGSGNKLYKKAAGTSDFVQYYEALDNGNNISGETFDTVIPFVHNDILYSIEFDFEGNSNAAVKYDHTNDGNVLNDSLGLVIGTIPNVKKVYWVGVIASKITVLCDNRVSVSSTSYRASRLYTNTALVERTKNFEQQAIQEGANTNGVNFDSVYGTYYEPATSLLHYAVADSGGGNTQIVTWNGTSISESLLLGQYTFGHHKVGDQWRNLKYNPSTGVLSMKGRTATSVETLFEQSIPNQFKYNIGTLQQGGIFGKVVEGKDKFFILYQARNSSTEINTIIVSYDKVDFSVNWNIINRRVSYFAPNDFITGIGEQDIYYELEATTGEPTPPPEPEPEKGFFDIPKMQSVSFSRAVGEEGSDDLFFPDVLNHRQQKDRFSSFGYGFCYSQRFRQSDVLTIQYRKEESGTIVLDLIDEDGVVVSSYTATKKTEYQANNLIFPVSIQQNGGGTSRVYFQGRDTVPVDLVIGESTVDIFNASLDGFDGSYLVAGIQVDATLNQEYIVIDREYDTAQSQVLADIGVTSVTIPFDIYESSVDLSTVNEGNYYLKAYLDGFENDTAFYSEPIVIKGSFKDTLKIQYSNFDNAFNIDYSTGIINIIRPECIMFKRIPSTNTTTIRNTDNTVSILKSKPQRKFEIEFIMLPPYLMEKLAVAFSHDSVIINGVQFVCEEGLSEPEYVDRFGLARATAVVEQVGWFDTLNSDDIGGLEADQGLIIQNDGFIKR